MGSHAPAVRRQTGASASLPHGTPPVSPAVPYGGTASSNRPNGSYRNHCTRARDGPAAWPRTRGPPASRGMTTVTSTHDGAGSAPEAAALHEIVEGVFAWVQPDGTWWINNAGAVGGPGGTI